MFAKTLLLAGTAALAMTALPIAAAAEMPSSPAELAQTRALNTSARAGTLTSPCVLNGQNRASAERKACLDQRAASTLHHRYAKTAYDLRNYHSTANDSGRPYGRMSEYGTVETMPADGSGARMPYSALGNQQATSGSGGFYEQSSTRPVTAPEDFVPLTVVDPAHLAGIPVESLRGLAIGRVSTVDLARDGTAAELRITLADGRAVRVSPATLKYNPNRRILLINLGIGELTAMAE